MTNPSLNIRSEVVQEILSSRPHWLIRWGNTITLGVCALLLTGATIVEYPVYVPVKITSGTGPGQSFRLPSEDARKLENTVRLELRNGQETSVVTTAVSRIDFARDGARIFLDQNPDAISATAEVRIRIRKTFLTVIADQLLQKAN